MKKIVFILGIGLLVLFAACSNVTTNNMAGSNDMADNIVDPIFDWQTITATEANNMMATMDDFILIDVRTEAEFREMRIDGAILIPHNEIRNRAETELTDKNAVILLYCQSGRRSSSAAADLAALGYTNVYDFGGILSWPYEVIRD